MLTPAPFFYLPFQAFSQNAQPSRSAGMIFGAWGIFPNKHFSSGCYPQTLLAASKSLRFPRLWRIIS